MDDSDVVLELAKRITAVEDFPKPGGEGIFAHVASVTCMSRNRGVL
jgi:hypothetical protein